MYQMPLNCHFKVVEIGNFPVVQGLGLCVFTAEVSGSIPGKDPIPQAVWHGQNSHNKTKS